MKIFKSHFWYTKNQRNGILLLLIIIIFLQLILHFKNFDSQQMVDLSLPKITSYNKQLDSLKKKSSKKKKFKIYPFNPNYISDYKGYQLGMNVDEIDRLLAHREQRLYVNSAKEFQTITKISDSLLQKISPFFKFPEWVQKKNNNKNNQQRYIPNSRINVSEITTVDINKATLKDFTAIEGVDEYISERIIKYRSKLQGFSFKEQLFEVWGLDELMANKILSTFSIKNKPIIKKVNINTASFKEVLSNPYIDYELCIQIFDYKDEVAELQSISEIKNIEGFPIKKYNRIVLYLLAE
jgi:DNA uptake protein ComE-like DNA-binding protein